MGINGRRKCGLWAERSDVCTVNRAFRWWEGPDQGMREGVLSTAVRASRKRLDGVLYLARQLICRFDAGNAHWRVSKLQQFDQQRSSDDIWSQNPHASRSPYDPPSWSVLLHPVFRLRIIAHGLLLLGRSSIESQFGGPC